MSLKIKLAVEKLVLCRYFESCRVVHNLHSGEGKKDVKPPIDFTMGVLHLPIQSKLHLFAFQG